MKKIMETFTINDFFNEQNEITNINEEAYHHIEDIRETIDSCTRTSDECFYIIDYHKRNFLHVSDNPTSFCGKDQGNGIQILSTFCPRRGNKNAD
mgnify:CR=1 FL=1